MKILNFRHFGLVVQNLQESKQFYEKAGFVEMDQGVDVVGPERISWIKMYNESGVVLELLNGGMSHMAFTVDAVVPEHYYYVAPSGVKIQFGRDPNGLPIEFVEEKKGD